MRRGSVRMKARSERRRAAGRIGLALICAITLASCSTIERRHGYTPDDATLSLVEIGRDTRESVAEKVGDPAALGVLAEGDFYYVSSVLETFAYRPTVEAEREVVAISFDGGGRVANVERFGLERGRIVPLSRRVTESNVRGIGILRQLFGSLGQLSAEDVLDE